MVSCAQALRKPLPPGVEPAQVLSEFINAVNMEPEEIHVFLQTEESRRGAEEGTDEEKDGRRLGRRVIELLHKVHEHRSDPHAYPLSLIYEADLQQMYQCAEYIKCHKEMTGVEGVGAQSVDRWHLMNFGYDPLKASN